MNRVAIHGYLCMVFMKHVHSCAYLLHTRIQIFINMHKHIYTYSYHNFIISAAASFHEIVLIFKCMKREKVSFSSAAVFFEAFHIALAVRHNRIRQARRKTVAKITSSSAGVEGAHNKGNDDQDDRPVTATTFSVNAVKDLSGEVRFESQAQNNLSADNSGADDDHVKPDADNRNKEQHGTAGVANLGSSNIKAVAKMNMRAKKITDKETEYDLLREGRDASQKMSKPAQMLDPDRERTNRKRIAECLFNYQDSIFRNKFYKCPSGPTTIDRVCEAGGGSATSAIAFLNTFKQEKKTFLHFFELLSSLRKAVNDYPNFVPFMSLEDSASIALSEKEKAKDGVLVMTKEEEKALKDSMQPRGKLRYVFPPAFDQIVFNRILQCWASWVCLLYALVYIVVIQIILCIILYQWLSSS